MRAIRAGVALSLLALAGCVAVGAEPTAVRRSEITIERPLPAPGYGLYVYVLPGEEVNQDILAAVARFHCSSLHDPLLSDTAAETALVVLPVHPAATQGTAARIDISLAHDLMQTSASHWNERRVYIIVVSHPLVPHRQAQGVQLAPLPIAAPQVMSGYLTKLRRSIEERHITTPSQWDAWVQSFPYAVGVLLPFLGSSEALAAEPVRSRISWAAHRSHCLCLGSFSASSAAPY